MALKDKILFRVEGSRPAEKTGRSFVLHYFGLLVTTFGVAFCITSLYLAMRGVMRLGGMVARGGPYEIAHPAPNWIWVVPVSIILGMMMAFANFYFSHRGRGLNLMVLAWPALFLSLGWNFLDFGFNPLGGGRGLVWGWVVCGVVFVLMGGVPLAVILRAGWDALRGSRHSRREETSFMGKSGFRGVRVLLLLLQLASVGLGVYGSTAFLDMLTGEKEPRTTQGAPAAIESPPRPLEPTRPAPSPPPAQAEAPRPRIVIAFEHNTLEIVPGQGGVFYNGGRFDGVDALPPDARRALEQALNELQTRIRRSPGV